MAASQLINAQIIGPIVNDNFYRYSPKDQVIINFGGMECPFIEIGKNSTYPFTIIKNLLPLLEQHFLHILVTGRARIMKMLSAYFPESPSLTFQMLDQKSMLEELYQSQALFTTPGIQSFFDAADKVPIFCLPPHSNSQFRNLDTFIDQGAIQYYVHLNELYDFTLSQDEFLGEADEIKAVLEKIRIFEKSEKDQKYFRNKVKRFLENQHIWVNLVSRQQKVLENLGKSGIKSIINEIHHTLQGTIFSSHLICKGV